MTKGVRVCPMRVTSASAASIGREHSRQTAPPQRACFGVHNALEALTRHVPRRHECAHPAARLSATRPSQELHCRLSCRCAAAPDAAAAAPPQALPPRARRLAAKRSVREAERAAKAAQPQPPQRHHALLHHAPPADTSAEPVADPLADVATAALLTAALKAAHEALRLPPKADADAALPLSPDDVAAALLARASRMPLQQLADAAWALEAAKHPGVVALRAAIGAPFTLLPGALAPLRLRLEDLREEVALSRDNVQTASGRVMPEARLTAWQSDGGHSFTYSGKNSVPPPGGLTPKVAAVRDELAKLLGVSYDSCLVNLYPDGSSGMRYHSDPQGKEWAADTAVVSIGAPRRFVFRAIGDHATRCGVIVRSGDVVHMGPGCQERFQHAILPEASAESAAPRISLVFKLRREH